MVMSQENNIHPKTSSNGKVRKRKAGKISSDDSTPASSVGISGSTERNYASWAEDETGRLLDWLEDPTNYDLYRGAGKVNFHTGKINTTGKTKQSIYRAITAYLQHLGSTRTIPTVKNKICGLEKGYKNALAYLTQSGSGIDNPDAETIEAKMTSNRGTRTCGFCV